MSAKMILTMLFFVSLSVVVILGLRALPQRMNGDTAERSEEILVAATTLQIGTLLRAKDVTWQQIGGSAGLGKSPVPAMQPAAPISNSISRRAPKCMGLRCVAASRLASRSAGAPL
jgi:hypothetical protein